MIVPDLNLLLYAYRIQDPNHAAASSWWQRLTEGSDEIGIPWSVAIGFIRLITHPSSPSGPLSVDVAVECVSEWFRHPHIKPIEPGAQHIEYVARNLEVTGTGGNLVTDAHIAAIAIEYDAEVHSADSDFGRFPGLRWHNPLRASTAR